MELVTITKFMEIKQDLFYMIFLRLIGHDLFYDYKRLTEV